jgi:hypothetical protein
MVLSAGSASAASTPITKSLPITSFGQVVADSARGYLFFSEGSDLYSPTGGTNAILVTNLDGNTVTTITGLSGVKGLALSPTGSTLYAALAGTDEIAAISTSTLKVSATYSTSTSTFTYTPYTLAFEDGILWIGYENGTLGQSGVGYIDPAAADPTFVPEALPANWYFAPSISGDPDHTSASSTTGTLVVSSPGTSPTPVNSFEISGTTVTSNDSADLGGSYSPEYGLDVLPGGSRFVLDDSIYETTDISAGPESTYPAEGDSAAAVAPNGWMAIGYATDSSTGDAGIVTFPSRSTTADPAAGYQGLGDTYSSVAGLAWSSDSPELFAVITQDNSSGSITGYTLQTLYPPTPLPLPPVPLSLSTSATTVGYKGTVKVTVGIAITDDPNTDTVNIYETPVGGRKKLLKTVALGSGETLTFTTGQLTTSTAFTASADGDSVYSATTTPARTVDVYASVQASISGYYGSKSISGVTYRVYHHTAKLKDAVTVAPNKHGECVKLEMQRGTSSDWKAYYLSGCTDLNGSSKATISLTLSKYSIGGKYRIRADFHPSSGDKGNLSTDGAWLYFIVEK